MTAEERLAVVETELRGARAELSEIKDDVKALTEAMYRGKGALTALLTIAGLIGAGAATLIAAIFGKS